MCCRKIKKVIPRSKTSKLQCTVLKVNISTELGPEIKKENYKQFLIQWNLMEVDKMKWQSMRYYSKHEPRAYVQSGEVAVVVGSVLYACSFLR